MSDCKSILQVVILEQIFCISVFLYWTKLKLFFHYFIFSYLREALVLCSIRILVTGLASVILQQKVDCYLDM